MLITNQISFLCLNLEIRVLQKRLCQSVNMKQVSKKRDALQLIKRARRASIP